MKIIIELIYNIGSSIAKLVALFILGVIAMLIGIARFLYPLIKKASKIVIIVVLVIVMLIYLKIWLVN